MDNPQIISIRQLTVNLTSWEVKYTYPSAVYKVGWINAHSLSLEPGSVW